MGGNYRCRKLSSSFLVLSCLLIIWTCSSYSQVLCYNIQLMIINMANGNGTRNVLKCDSKSPLNLSKDICGDLCHKNAVCSKDSGACVCEREPTPTTLGGHFTHCTNWNYVEQSECKGMCTSEWKNDSRVCWTFTVGNYCTCF